MKDKEFYFIEVIDCDVDILVLAKNKTEAKEKAFKELNEIYPPETLKNCDCKPYRKKDIYSCKKLTDCLVDDVLMIF